MSVAESHESPDLVTKAEAAQVLRVSVRTFDRYIAAGRIERLATPTGRPRFRRADVNGLVERAA